MAGQYWHSLHYLVIRYEYMYWLVNSGKTGAIVVGIELVNNSKYYTPVFTSVTTTLQILFLYNK